MGNCNLNCCNCIEKKETQINHISNKKDESEIYKNRINPIKKIEFSNFVKDNKYDASFYSLDDDDKNATKRTNKTNTNKLNDTTQSISFYKDISFKYSKKIENNLFNETANKNKNDLNINVKEDKDIFIYENKKIDEFTETNNGKREFNNLKYYNTDFKKSKFSIYLNYVNNKNIDNNNQGISINHSNVFPLRYNYQKDKYISYFTEDNN